MNVYTSRFANILSLKNVNNFHPLEVMGRDSETQLQVGENLILNVELQGLKNIYKIS